ncbi:MAG TPA: hypothetical protein VFT70_08000 [Nocardioides sp.]|nr:hypothetical protein [Nocardioides sp.]
MTTLLRDALHDELDAVPAPPGDLTAVRRRGRRIRGTRRAAAGGAAALLVGVVAGLTWPHGSAGDRGVEPVGPLDYSHGLRAYADPGVALHLGGRTIAYGDLQGLDTDAAATPDGVVYYAVGVPYLLPESGEARTLEPDAEPGSFAPTAKADSLNPWVAYGAVLDGRPTVVVRDTGTGEEVGHRRVTEDTVIDALHDGVVMLRDQGGTVAWDAVRGTVEEVAGPKTRIADVQGSVMLYDGPRPDGPGADAYQLVQGGVDAQLTFDGQFVLSWSPVLESTGTGGPLRLALPENATFFTIDTDGSILAAVPRRGGGSTVYDCPESTAECALLGTLAGRGGDPEFIGNDM